MYPGWVAGAVKWEHSSTTMPPVFHTYCIILQLKHDLFPYLTCAYILGHVLSVAIRINFNGLCRPKSCIFSLGFTAVSAFG